MLTLREKLKLLRIATCIILCHVIIAILQEKMFKRPYGTDESKEKFDMAVAYSGVQCFAYAIISGGILSSLLIRILLYLNTQQPFF